MTTFDTTKWYRHVVSGDARPLVPEPDDSGHIPVMLRKGRYTTVLAARLTLIPERHTFERRLPKAGERCISYFGEIIVTQNDYAFERWVVVEDEFDPAAELETYRAWRKTEETS